MTLSEFSIRRPVFAWMLMSALIIFGGICFMRMGISELPDVDFPVVTVSLNYEGAAPEVMELDVVDPVESAVMTIQGVKSVSSSSRTGSANVSVEFELGRDIDIALQEIQTKVAQLQKTLPREMDPPVITKSNPEDQPIIWLAATSDTLELKDLMAYVRDFIKDQFSRLPGVGEIFLGGYIEPNLRVWTSDKKLNEYALTVGDLIATIQNEHIEPPGGRVQNQQNEFSVRTLGEATSVEAFEKLIISSRGGQPNYQPLELGKVAKVEEGMADIRRLSRAMGVQAIGLGVRKQRGANAVAVGQAVKARMKEIEPQLMPGVKIAVNFDNTKFIEEAVHELNFTLILSAILTALVCLLFLGSLSATINVVLAIPTSIVGTFIVLYFAGFTLNTFTLLGLSLAIGIVVDDAIMMLENITRHSELGKNRWLAALDGSKEITFAALAATIAIVAIFLPVVFMEGIIGKFFYQFGITMTVAVLLSLLEALTLTPMRCAQFMSNEKRTTRIGHAIEFFINSLQPFYHKTLQSAISRPWLTIIASLIFFAVSCFSVKFLNKEFLPPQDQSRFMIRIQTPVGSSLAFTDRKFKEIENFIMQQPEVERYYGAVGGFGGGEVNTGNVFVTLKPPGKRGKNAEFGRELTQQQFMDFCRKRFSKIEGLKAFFQDLSSRGFSASRGFPVEFTIRGPDWDKLAEYSQQIMKKLEETQLVSDVNTDYQIGLPEIQVYPDRVKAALHGVSVLTIGQTVNAVTNGVLVGRYPKDGHRNEIRLKITSPGIETNTKDVISKLYVRNNRGELVELSKVVNIVEKPTLQMIARKDRERAISIFANVKTGASQEKALQAATRISNEILPKGYRAVLSGSAQTYKESIDSLLFALLLGIIVSYMVLASQFNSFIHPISVLMALPFSVSGAFLALLIMGQSLNIYSMIGLILLMGIVKKNSILLVEFTNQLRERGAPSVKEAVLNACPIRLRPILMTSIATIAGALPPALAFGPGAETRIPMAVGVIGGVFVSTLLTLYVVPCVYLLLSRFETKAAHEEVKTLGAA